MSQNKKKLYEIIKNKGVHPALIKEIAEPSIAENVPMQCSVGLEFELENLEGNFNKGVLRQDIWQEKRDGSLRGDGREFVLTDPIKGETIQTALENIYACCREGSMVKLSNARTSMHMHVNVSDCSEAELLVMLGVCALADDYLFSITNANRKNSGYCGASTEALIQGISNHQCNVTNYPKGNTEQRYRSVNTEAINKYGSIEFRHFSVPDTLEEAKAIVKTCLSLKQIARKVTQELNIEEAANFKARKKINKKTEQLTRSILTRARELLAEVVNPDYLPEIKKLMDVWEIQTLLNLPDKKKAIPGQRLHPAAMLQQRMPGQEIEWRIADGVRLTADALIRHTEGENRTPVDVTAPERVQQATFEATHTRDPFFEEVWPTDPFTTTNPPREATAADIEAHAEQQQRLAVRAEEQLQEHRRFILEMDRQRRQIREAIAPIPTLPTFAATEAGTTTATTRTVTLGTRDLEILRRAGINING